MLLCWIIVPILTNKYWIVFIRLREKHQSFTKQISEIKRDLSKYFQRILSMELYILPGQKQLEKVVRNHFIIMKTISSEVSISLKLWILMESGIYYFPRVQTYMVKKVSLLFKKLIILEIHPTHMEQQSIS